MHHETREDLRARGMQVELELRHDAEVAAAAADGPEQIRMMIAVHGEHARVGSHEPRAAQVVDREAVLARGPAEAAAERQARDAGGRVHARRHE
jgi:hypothetical protein